MREIDRGNLAAGVIELGKAADLNAGDAEYRRDWLQQRQVATNKLLALASAHAAAGRFRDAEAAYREVMKFEPNNARALAGLDEVIGLERDARAIERASGLVGERKYGAAIAELDAVLERQPRNPDARRLRQEAESKVQRALPATSGMASMYRKPVNLEFRDANVKAVFDALSRTTGINFIYDRDIKPETRISVSLKQTLFEEAVDLILATHQLEKKVLNATSVLIYPNTPAKVKEHQDLIVRAFYLSNIDAKTAANLLKTVLKIKDVYTDEKYHMLVLRESADTIALAEKLIALQDLEDPEVMLEVEVVEVNRSRLLNLGIQLTNQLTIAPLGASTGGTTGNGSTPANYRLSDLLDLNKSKLGITVPSATVTLQKTVGDANLLANPRLRVRDRDKARFLIGDKVPVVTTTTTPNGFLSENVQYLDVGLKLEVEPEIYLHDEIGLKLSLEVSSLVGSIKTTTGSQAYQIGTRNFSSSLRLRDGETQVLAGLISDADRSDANRIPLLGDVPLLGRLFSSQKDDRQKTEIVMAITPHLIRNIARKSPAAEQFWSGTEAVLRTKAPEAFTDSPKDMKSQANDARPRASAQSEVVAPDPSGVRFRWITPETVKAGQIFKAELELETPHQLRALPLQLAYDPQVLEVMSVQVGEFFGPEAAASFGTSIDKEQGRVSIGLAGAEGKPAKGKASLVRLELKALTKQSDGELSVIGATPVGSTSAVERPRLPATARIEIE